MKHIEQTKSRFYELVLIIMGNSTAGLITDFSLKKKVNWINGSFR